jgi:proton glutamate symport protein
MTGTIERPVKLGWILGAMALGVALGLLVDSSGHLLGLPLVVLGGFLGSVFLNLLKMLVVPLVVSSIISGVAGMGNARDLGRLGLISISFYVITTLIAVVIALVVVNAISPGVINGAPARDLLALGADAGSVNATVQAQAGRSLPDIVLSMIPSNIFEAAVGGKLVGLLIFGLLFGYFITQLDAPLRETMTRFWEGLFHVMMRMTGWVMRLAPIGVFGLTLKVTAEAGVHAAVPLLLFGLCVVLSLAIYAFMALPLLISVVGRVNPWRLFPAMAPALLTAFSTASSSSTLPVTLECIQKRAGVSPRIAGFVLPLGTSINHAGSALYECAAALFIAQAYGLHLSLVTQVTVVLLALVTSMGIAGIPAASLVGITVILGAVGLPAEAIGVLLVLDRLLDMARTAVNVLADSAATVIVARLTGDEGALAPRPALPESSSRPY